MYMQVYRISINELNLNLTHQDLSVYAVAAMLAPDLAKTRFDGV